MKIIVMDNRTMIEKLIEKKEAERLTAKEIADLLDVPFERVNSWIKRKGQIKYDDGIKILEWINGNKKSKNEQNIVQEPTVQYNSNRVDELLSIINKLSDTVLLQQKTIQDLVDKQGKETKEKAV